MSIVKAVIYRFHCDKRVGSAGQRAPRCNAVKKVTADSLEAAKGKAEKSGWQLISRGKDDMQAELVFCPSCSLHNENNEKYER